MTTGAGLVVRADGSGCRLVEYDSAGRVVGPGEPIRLSENELFQNSSLAPKLATIMTPAAEVARLLDKVRTQLSDASTLTGTDRDPQAAFTALAEVVGGYREAAARRPDLWKRARAAAYLDEGVRGY